MFCFQETYISQKKKTLGKLNQRYYAVSRKFQQRGLIKSRYNIKPKTVKDFVVLTAPVPVVTEEVSAEKVLSDNNQKAWLQINKTPEITVCEKWQQTYELRRKDILARDVNLYTEWPLLKQQIGASLVSLNSFKSVYRNWEFCLRCDVFYWNSVSFSSYSLGFLIYYDIFKKVLC